MFFVATLLYKLGNGASVSKTTTGSAGGWNNATVLISFVVFTIGYPVVGTFMKSVLTASIFKFVNGKIHVDISFVVFMLSFCVVPKR